VTVDRHLHWEGCFNARDLGGLPTTDGRTTRWRAVVRSDTPDHLTAAGWEALRAYGIRTIVDLRNDEEVGPDAGARPASVTTVHVPLDDTAGREFWDEWASGPQFGTPLYYRPFLERKPDRCAAAVAAVARAGPGGVLVHCGGGRDRTGLVTMVLLALAGVAPEEIASDYELSYERMPRMYAARGEDDQGPTIQGFLAGDNTSARAAIVDTLDWLDADAYLRSAGLGNDDLAAPRERLVEPDGPTPPARGPTPRRDPRASREPPSLGERP
jgi:protein-tyrosine phosphatase